MDKREHEIHMFNTLGEWCKVCKGVGWTYDDYGTPMECVNYELHDFLTYLGEISGKYPAVEAHNATLKSKICKLSEQNETLTAHLDNVQRIANVRPEVEYSGLYDPLTAATKVLNEIRAEVHSRHQHATLSRMRAGAVRDAANRLHVDLGAGVCVCGEPWEGEERGCVERRRVRTFADRMEQENADGELAN